MSGRRMDLPCPYCDGAGCLQANGEPCGPCGETGMVEVTIHGPAKPAWLKAAIRDFSKVPS